MKVRLLLVVFLSLFLVNTSFALEEKTTIRVGISNQSFSSWDFQSVKLSSSNVIKIVDMSNSIDIEDISALSNVEVRMNLGLFNIYIDGLLKYKELTGPLVISSNADIELVELNRKGTPAKYKGMIELRAAKNPQKFNIINVVDLDSYLNGVVPNEMPISFGLEALKAQAIAAKNYVTNAKISQNYDVVDSTASQVYYGSNSYRDISNQAIKETKGIYALYNDKPISALYYSTSSGISDDWDDVFNGGVKSSLHPYLKAKYETTTKPLTSEKDVREFLTGKNGFDTNSPKHRWSYEWTRSELEEVLHNNLQQQSRLGLVEPKYDGDVKLSGLKEIKITKRTQSAKALEMLIVADSGEYKVKKEIAIRRVLKKNNAMLPSSTFFVEAIGEEELNQNTKTNTESFGAIKLFDKLFDEKYPKSFKVVGGGFGHGVGMSQFGAYNLAKNGKKYPEILKFYYTGISLSTIPKNVSHNNYDIKYATQFYFDSKAFKKAYIIIENKRGVVEFPFKINDYEFNETATISNNQLIKMDITQYLKQGVNTVLFPSLDSVYKNKYITFRIEFI